MQTQNQGVEARHDHHHHHHHRPPTIDFPAGGRGGSALDGRRTVPEASRAFIGRVCLVFWLWNVWMEVYSFFPPPPSHERERGPSSARGCLIAFAGGLDVIGYKLA